MPSTRNAYTKTNIASASYLTSSEDSVGYRYGFGGWEKDNEVKGSGNHLSFGDYGYDPRIGRRWRIDPQSHAYPSHSGYSYALDNPIYFIDKDGAYIVDKDGNIV